tara:strand:+ start:2641 stop:2916 length:276 start_codon:yes stop_codon:yes gene_type:complete
MNKSDIAEILSSKNTSLVKQDIESSIKIILNYLSSTLSEGNRIEVRGFGTFSLRKRNSRVGRNPKTGKSIIVQEKYHPYFRASKTLKSILK